MKQLLGNFSWLVAGNIFSTIIRALALLLLVRQASPSDFAVYVGVFGLLTFGKAISDLGLTKFIIRDRSVDISSTRHGQALRINTLTSISLGLISTLALLIAAFLGPEILWAILPMGITASFEKNADTWRSVYLADEKAYLLVLMTLIGRFLTLVLFVGLLTLTPGTVILSMTVAELIAAFVTLIGLRQSLRGKIILPRQWSNLNFREILIASRPYWTHGLAMHSRNLDVSIVGLFAPVAQAGYFAAASRLTGPIQLIPSALASALLPHAARSKVAGGDRPGSIIFVMFTLFAGGCAILAFITPYFVPVFMGEHYLEAILTMQIIIASLPFAVYSNLVSAALQGEGLSAAVSNISWVYAFILLIGIAMGAALAGAEGAAVASLIANLVLAACLLGLWRRTGKSLE